MKQVHLPERIFQPYYRFLERWAVASRKKRIWMFLGIYSVVFFFTFFLAYSTLLLEGRSFVMSGDGNHQFLPALIYIGQFWRQVIDSFLQGAPSLPLFNLSLGFGEDVIGTLNYYRFGDPMALLSVLVPLQYAEYLFNFLVILSLYLSGLSFCALCCYCGKRASFFLIGSIVYVFSGYAVFSTLTPMFLSPMIQFPLLLIGTDQILKGKRSWLFIFTVFYSALCGFYFLYMMTIMVGIYALVRFFDLVKEHRVQTFVLTLGRGIGNYLLGLGLAGAVFLPSVALFLSSSRTGKAYQFNPLSYGLRYYLTRLPKLFAPTGSDACLSLAVISALAAALLLWDFIRNRRRRTLVLLLAAAALIYVLPVCGSVMNGFSYPTQRWTFAAALLLSYITVEMLPSLLSLPRLWRTILLGAFTLYVIITHAARGAVPLALALLAVTAVALALPALLPCNSCSSLRRNHLTVLACLILTMANVITNVIFSFDPNVTTFSYAGWMISHETATAQIMDAPERLLHEACLTGEGRCDGIPLNLNYGVIWDVPMSYGFWSISNWNTIQLHHELENADMHNMQTILRLDDRTALGTLLSNRYFIIEDGQQAQVPFGYRLTVEQDGYLIYENEYALPWGYTYDSVLSSQSLESLNGLEKQEALLQGIALGSPILSGQAVQPQITSESVPYTLSLSGATWENGILTVEKAGGSITLEYSMPPGVEEYVYLKDFWMETSETVYPPVLFQSGEAIQKRIETVPPTHVYHFTDNCLCNLGYSEDRRTSCTVSFELAGTYQLSDIQVYAQPMDSYVEYVEALREEPLENIVMGTNEISGTVDLSRDKILCLSIPYSRGWSATVDGQPVEILRGNYMFMAIPLQAGYHEIELHYFTPGLKLGLAATGASAVILTAMLLLDRKKRRKQA